VTPRREILSLAALFGTLYFIQGLVEPTDGLLGQPVRSHLDHWSLSAKGIGELMAFVAIPWTLKPLFGLLSDFLPLGGSRRRSYLILSTAAAAAALACLGLRFGRGEGLYEAGWLLLAVTAAVAMTDVVVDGLSVEVGQPRGITGQLQSVQWGSASVATILGGSLGGFVAQNGHLKVAFFGCAALSLVGLAVVLVAIREPERHRPAETVQAAWRQLRDGRRWAVLLAVAAFLFLWSFNPFNVTVLQLYMTNELGLSEQFYGHMYSLQSAAQVAACLAYGLYCRRVPLRWLLHASIVAGILATVAYWGLYGQWSAVVVTVAVGLTYQLGSLVLLDLAARACPTESAGTVFAILMALSNSGVSLGIYVGGGWYDTLASPEWLGSRHAAFDTLVGIGAAFTAGCWLLVPWLQGAAAHQPDA
jgi:predicted MFS family arabinose efflux permease